MAGRRPVPPRPVKLLASPDVDDPQTSRAIATVADAVQTLQSRGDRAYVTFHLLIGTNRVPHGLGRPYRGFSLTPTVLTSAFAYAVSSDKNPRPDLEVWIDVEGSDQPDCMIEVY